MTSKSFTYMLLIGILLSACVSKNDLDFVPIPEEETEGIDSTAVNEVMADLNVPDNFSYETTKNIKVTLDVPNFLKGAVFNLYSKIGQNDSIPLGRGTFDEAGHFEQEYVGSMRTDSVLVYSDYVGLVDNIRLAVQQNQAEFDYRTLYTRTNTGKKYQEMPKRLKGSGTSKAGYTFIDTFDANGVPDNLAFADIIQQNLLDDVNASLPESVRGGIPVSNPEFLAGKETSLIITKEADIWVTFLSEGAGYRNVLGYYTYPLGSEPQSKEEITEHNVIFPNVSMVGSSGGLLPGDRVYLGRFPANTVVSWFLVANGWWGNGVSNGNGVYYSNPDFNPESTAEKRNHMVLLNDPARQLAILGFEDLNRDGSSDDDFNDAVFYAKANPVDAIQLGNVAAIKVANDSDGDGINDELDDFPFDVNKAFNNFSPSINDTGKLVYEDLWPNQGDYDFNDLVVDYSYNLIANADNLVSQINADYNIVHIGASFRNGFAITLPIDPSNISQIEGQVLNGSFEDVASNGTENGTRSDETVIIVAGNTLNMTGQTVSLSITLDNPVERALLGPVPFNPFLIVNGDRSREVHLADMEPTSKASQLGEGDDYSDPSSNRFYKTKTNLPWALNIYENFNAPPEGTPITLQYPRFKNWANSGGNQDQDWFMR